jgi:membrane-bound ClpP family serine protease
MWIIIVALLAIGLALIIAEIIFIPGTTLVGVLGLVFAIAGIVISYRHFGSEIGLYIVIGMGLATAGTLYYSFKSRAWSKFSLKTSNKSRVNEGLASELMIGDEGRHYQPYVLLAKQNLRIRNTK